jgi:predicted GIY-YIG superfamily endonuclease
VTGTVLAEASTRAPRLPGVYFFLGAADDLLYVGMATDLRRRLGQHAREWPAPGLRDRYRLVRDVVWETHPDVDSAARREADVIVGLRPPHNAWVDEARWVYLTVRPSGEGRLSFTLEETLVPDARVYGCFPYLGRGVSLRPAVACSDGYVALLRLIWAAGTDGPTMPARITRSAPPSFEVALSEGHGKALHAFLSGVSLRLLDDLWTASQRRDAYLHVALRRDREAAAAFFVSGPRAIRRIRLRHGLPPGPVTRRAFEDILAAEIAAVIGG